MRALRAFSSSSSSPSRVLADGVLNKHSRLITEPKSQGASQAMRESCFLLPSAFPLHRESSSSFISVDQNIILLVVLAASILERS